MSKSTAPTACTEPTEKRQRHYRTAITRGKQLLESLEDPVARPTPFLESFGRSYKLATGLLDDPSVMDVPHLVLRAISHLSNHLSCFQGFQISTRKRPSGA
jgi:hypothetical protein